MISQPNITTADIAAVRALIGDPNHARALHWIMVELCRSLDNVYQPGEDGRRDTDFELGRQFVAITIGSMTRESTLQKAIAAEQKQHATPSKRRGRP